MSKPDRPPRKRRSRWLLAILGTVLLGLVGLALYINSDSFRETVRNRVVAELERMTGGRVELESFGWSLSQLRVEARGLTIHGLEGSGEEPYVRIDRMSLRLRIISFISRKIALDEVVIDHLAVHLMVGPTGVTNQPAPKGVREGVSAEQLFDLAVKRVEIKSGTLLLNQERIPFQLAGDRFSASMTYSPQDRGYDGTVAVAVSAARWGGHVPVNGELDLRFLLRATEMEIRSLKITTGHSTLQASGALHNFDHPEIQLQYTAALDLRDVAKQARIPEIHSGRGDVKGSLKYQAARYSTEGDLTLHGVEWYDPSLPLRASVIDANSSFTVTPEKITLPRFAARVFGGSIQGEAQAIHWNTPAAPHKTTPQRGTATVQVSRLQVGQLAAAVSSARLPLNKIDLAGSVSGDVKANWQGPLKNAVAEMSLDITPPASPSMHEIPVTARLRATYRGDARALEIAGLNASTRAISLNASGELGSRTAQARVSVKATSLHELQPALDALRPGTHLPLAVQGRASFDGSVFGNLDALSARGRVELENFETEAGALKRPSAAAQPSAPPSSRVHWDSLAAEVNYSPSGISLQGGTLRRGKAQVGFSATVSLHQGMFDENTSQLTADLRVENLAVQDVQSLAGMNYPVTGTVSAAGHVSGTANNLRGEGNLQIAKLTAYNENFSAFRSQVQVVGREVLLNNLALTHNGAQVMGSVAYDLGKESFRYNLTGANFDLATFQVLQAPRLSMEGKAGFVVAGSAGANASNIILNGRLDVANLALNKEVLGNIHMTAETRGADLIVRGQSVFEDATVTLDGTMQLSRDFPAQLALRFSHVDVDPLIRAYLQGRTTGHSSIAGSVDIHGPMKRPQDLSITGNLSQLSAEVENIKLRNEGSVALTVQGGVLRANPFRLVGQDTDLYLHGSVQLVGDHALDLHTRGRVNLKLAQSFNPNILAYGPAVFTVDVLGTAAHPQMNGKFELVDAGVSFVDLPNGLSHINGTMVFAQDRVQIEKLTAHSGGGELNLGGFLAYRNGLYFDLTATGKDVRLRYPPGVSSSADANLRYTGSANSSLLSGEITVTRFGMNANFDFGTFLTQPRNTNGFNSVNPFLANLRLDVHIISTPELRVETTLAKVSGDLDLHLRGTAARPSLLGRVNIAEGDIFFNGTKYRLERGDITFGNPLVIEPTVNMEMSARVQDYDITVGLHGTMSSGKSLSLTYRSDPPLSNTDIISLLAFGRPRGTGVYNTPSATGQSANADPVNAASNAILGQALDAAVSNRVERLFGNSRVKIDPQFIGQQNNPSARVTVEQTINNNITLTYITNVTQTAETVVQLEYNVDKNVSIVAVRDENGVLGFDVRIRRRKK
jgi:translocation and assembly module TamB